LRPCSPTSGGSTRSWFFPPSLSPTAIPCIAGKSGTGHPDVVIDGDQVLPSAHGNALVSQGTRAPVAVQRRDERELKPW
jgi:hypothetical protein